MRAVSLLTVSDPVVWEELAAEGAADALGPARDPLTREVADERALLQAVGTRLLIRYARRDAAEMASTRSDLSHRVEALPSAAKRVLFAAQRHALDGLVVGRQVWDPLHDAPSVRALHGAGLIESLNDPGEPFTGRYRLNPDLPDPPPVPYDFAEAAMGLTDDLSEPTVGVVGLLHDMASLAAALERVRTRRTLKGEISKADARKLGKRLGDGELEKTGNFAGQERWARALRGLEALGVVTTDPLQRDLHLDTGLESTLAGEVEDACDRLVHRLVDRDLHSVLPAIRAALKVAGDGAVDELVFLELLAEQHRDVLIGSWNRQGIEVYPLLGEQVARRYDDEGWEVVETGMIKATLNRLVRLGLLRRAPGVFAATVDGRQWASGAPQPMPPVWVTGDLELVVPPGSVTPWERFQLERLGRCLARDVVDRYRLEHRGLITWLSTHELDDALELLRRRCPGVPASAIDTLTAWAASAERIVLTRGVLVED